MPQRQLLERVAISIVLVGARSLLVGKVIGGGSDKEAAKVNKRGKLKVEDLNPHDSISRSWLNKDSESGLLDLSTLSGEKDSGHRSKVEQASDEGKWSGRLGFMLSAASSAIGLANMWKFPYMVGIYGGAAFIFYYLLFLLIAGIPTLLSEIALGQGKQRGVLGVFYAWVPRKFWLIWPRVILVTGFMVTCYYAVVAGWFLGYGALALTGYLIPWTQMEGGGQQLFEKITMDPLIAPFLALLFLALSLFIVSKSLKGGIERTSRALVPLLLGMLLGMSLWVFYQGVSWGTLLDQTSHMPRVLLDASLSGGEGHSKSFLSTVMSFTGLGEIFPVPSSLAPLSLVPVSLLSISSEGILAALGHAFFTLSLGQGTMITYGSYLKKDEPVTVSVGAVVLFDTLVSLLAAYIVLGLSHLYQVPLDSGPSLVFITLPTLFAKIPGGALLAAAFFMTLIFATVTSEISVIEPLIEAMRNFSKGSGQSRREIETVGQIERVDLDEHKDSAFTRQRASVILGMISLPWVLLISQDAWICEKFGLSMLELFDTICTHLLIPLGGLTVALFVALCLKPSAVTEQLQIRGRLAQVLNVTLRWVTPSLILIVFMQAALNLYG